MEENQLLEDNSPNQQINHFLEKFKYGTNEERAAAARRLGQLKAIQAVPELIDALKDSDENVRTQALFALVTIGDNKAVQALLANMLEDNDLSLATAIFLSNAHIEMNLDDLLPLLKASSVEVRQCAAIVLGGLKPEVAIPPLIQLLTDESKTVRSSSVYALGKFKTEQNLEILIKTMQNDQNPDVCSRAAAGLGHIKHVVVFDLLMQELKDENGKAREGAAEGLGNLGDVRAIDTLIECLKHDNDIYVRQASAIALGQLEGSNVIPALIWSYYHDKSISEDDERTKDVVAKVLYDLGVLPSNF